MITTETVVWRWDSDAFGESMPDTDPDGDTIQVRVNLRFPGQLKGVEAPHHYNYYRDYDPTTGRYLQSDPIGLAGGINTFGYVGGNPIMLFDPLGLSIRRLGDLYGDQINPYAPGCQEPMWVGGYIVGWKPCERRKENDCSEEDGSNKDTWDEWNEAIKNINDALHKPFPDPISEIRDGFERLKNEFEEADRKRAEQRKACREDMWDTCANPLKPGKSKSKDFYTAAICAVIVSRMSKNCNSNN